MGIGEVPAGHLGDSTKVPVDSRQLSAVSNRILTGQ